MQDVLISQLVVGDIIRIDEGRNIPADGRVIALDGELEIDERYLTGVSRPISVRPGTLCNATDLVTRGSATMLVEYVGTDTMIGRRVSGLFVGREAPKYSRQKGVEDHIFERKVTISGVGILFDFVCLSSVFGFRTGSCNDSLRLAAGIAIICCREAPRSVKTILTVGSARLAKEEGAISLRLDVIEALAGVDTLLADRTGTLSQNRLTAHEPYCISEDAEEVMTVVCLASGPGTRDPDPLEKAFSRLLDRFPKAKTDIDRFEILDPQPFNNETNLVQCLVESPTGARTLCVIGAPKSILGLCEPDVRSEVAERYKEKVDEFVYQGCRTMGIARKQDHKSWELMGAVPLSDAARSDAHEALILANNLGVTVKMMTGDAIIIGRVFAESIGLGGNVVNSQTISERRHDSEGVMKHILGADVYAECFPEDRHKALSALQMNGHRVAMTGDSNHHTTALDLADCGIAVKGSTDAAQGSSDTLMLKPGISRMVNVIQITRQIFRHVHDSVVEQTTRNLHVVLLNLWHFYSCHEVLSIASILTRTNLTDNIMALSGSNHKVPYSLTPVRWSFRRVVREVLLLTSFLLIGAWSLYGDACQQGVKHQIDSDLSYLRENGSGLISYIAISECWLSSVIGNGGSVANSVKEIKLMVIAMLLQAVITVCSMHSIFGGDHYLSTKAVCKIWLTRRKAYWPS